VFKPPGGSKNQAALQASDHVPPLAVRAEHGRSVAFSAQNAVNLFPTRRIMYFFPAMSLVGFIDHANTP
jgi:hypothetical protein